MVYGPGIPVCRFPESGNTHESVYWRDNGVDTSAILAACLVVGAFGIKGYNSKCQHAFDQPD